METTTHAPIKVGDFIQTTSHFGDIYFEVTQAFAPCTDRGEWFVIYVTYDKYGSQPREVSTLGRIRRVVSAEMAEPTIRAKGERFHATHGQFDPFYGYAPRGTPLRTR